MVKLLVLDAAQRSALAITRSLGSKGLHVVCADECARTLAGSSRYCAQRLTYPSPYLAPDSFVKSLAEIIRSHDIDMVIPVSEVSTALVLNNRERLPEVKLPCRNPSAFELLTDKARVLTLAEQLGIGTPRSVLVDNPADARAAAEQIGYPVVLKPHTSHVFGRGHWTKTAVHYADSGSELDARLSAQGYLREHPFLVQEFIRGTGKGMFTLYDRGRPVVFFEHRRIREKPPSGGVSVLCESCSPDPQLVRCGRALFDHVGWDGVAMAEFKVTDCGIPYLMEVNARFWGSLQLAIDSGVDFPYMLYQSVAGETPNHSGNYRAGVRSRWLLGDLDHLYLRLIEPHRTYLGLPSPGRAVVEFLDFFDRETRYEINRCGDLRPFFFELASYVGLLGQKTSSENDQSLSGVPRSLH